MGELARQPLFQARTNPLMNLFNALGFFVLGLAMEILPELAPSVATINSFGDTAALWLQFMGAVIFLIGSGYTAKGLAASLPRSIPETRASRATVQARARAALPPEGEQAAV